MGYRARRLGAKTTCRTSIDALFSAGGKAIAAAEHWVPPSLAEEMIERDLRDQGSLPTESDLVDLWEDSVMSTSLARYVAMN